MCRVLYFIVQSVYNFQKTGFFVENEKRQPRSGASLHDLSSSFPIIVVALQIEKMKDDFCDIDDPVPSYEEPSRLPNYSTSDTKTLRRPLQTQLAETRSSRISTA